MCDFCLNNIMMAELFQVRMGWKIPKERECHYLEMGENILIQWICPKSGHLQTAVVEDRWNEDTLNEKTDGVPVRRFVAGVFKSDPELKKRRVDETPIAPTQQIIPDSPPYEAMEEISAKEFLALIEDDGASMPLPLNVAEGSQP